MQRYRVLQTYVPPLIADWILEQSNLRETSVSVVIRDHLVAAWNRDNAHADRPGGAFARAEGVRADGPREFRGIAHGVHQITGGILKTH